MVLVKKNREVYQECTQVYMYSIYKIHVHVKNAQIQSVFIKYQDVAFTGDSIMRETKY